MSDLFTPLEVANIVKAKVLMKIKAEEFLNLLGKGASHAQTKVQDYLFFSGGAIASSLQGKYPKDYDLYCKTAEFNSVISEYLKNYHDDDIKDVAEHYRDFVGKDGKMVTENAITMNSNIQIILKHSGEPKQVRETFDFVHCMPYYDFGTDKLYISRDQYDLCVKKKLKVNNRSVVTAARTDKFLQRGYSWL